MKYEPLENFLRGQGGDELPLSFAEVEKIIGGTLPQSARRHEAWWSNNPTGHVNAQAWLRAGYRAARVDMTDEKVVFQRVQAKPTILRRHPAFSALVGTVRVMPGVDLTQPTDPEWGSLYD